MEETRLVLTKEVVQEHCCTTSQLEMDFSLITCHGTADFIEGLIRQPMAQYKAMYIADKGGPCDPTVLVCGVISDGWRFRFCFVGDPM